MHQMHSSHMAQLTRDTAINGTADAWHSGHVAQLTLAQLKGGTAKMWHSLHVRCLPLEHREIGSARVQNQGAEMITFAHSQCYANVMRESADGNRTTT